MAGAALELTGVTKRYGDTTAVDGVDLSVGAGMFATLVGPSGCGKSTILRLIAGLERQTGGRVAIGGRCIDGLRPCERGVAMVFQNYALYPHMSVAENIAMPLIMTRLGFLQRFPYLGRLLPGVRAMRAAIDADVRRITALLEIDRLSERRPGQLSGGQRQRVALGRAMVRDPLVFLMDEPLSNLDAQLRIQMRAELAALHRRLGVTFLYVTHDQIEAMTMSERIAVMMDGRIVQFGTPADIYERPADIRVARFFGSTPINLLPLAFDHAGHGSLFGRAVPIVAASQPGAGWIAAVRPEDITIVRRASIAEGVQVGGRLVALEDHGADLLLHAELEDVPNATLRVRVAAERRAQVQELLAGRARVTLAMPLGKIHVFESSGRRAALRMAAASDEHAAGRA